MANIVPPSTFRELFESMRDVYNGVYENFLEENSPSAEIAVDLLGRTIHRFPCDQVPPVFMYQDPMGVIRTVHHLHRAETPFGQPATPLTNKVFGLWEKCTTVTSLWWKYPKPISSVAPETSFYLHWHTSGHSYLGPKMGPGALP